MGLVSQDAISSLSLHLAFDSSLQIVLMHALDHRDGL